MDIVSEWGVNGAQVLGTRADVLVVVDVLSFSTCVDVACANGAVVFPFPLGDRTKAAQEAQRINAVLAGKRRDTSAKYTLSAPTLAKIPSGTKLLLPSPNGSRISAAVSGKPIFVGCLRNADAVARQATRLAKGGTIAVIPAGERWPDGSLRPAIEDLIGAGAIISALGGTLSAEAKIAVSAFHAAKKSLPEFLKESVSGQELRHMGFPQDVAVASYLNISSCAPLLRQNGFSDVNTNSV